MAINYVRWSKNNEEQILSSSRIIRNLHLSPKKKPEDLFEIDSNLHILNNLIDIEGIENYSRKFYLINKGFLRYQNYKKPDLHLLRKALNTEIVNWLNSLKREVQLLLPFHEIPSPSNNDIRFDVFNKNFHISNWDDFQIAFDFESFFYQNKDYTSISRDHLFSLFSPIVIKTSGKDPLDVYYESQNAIDLFRFTCNMFSVFGIYRYSSSGRYEEPISKYLPSPLYGIFDLNGSLITSLFSTIANLNYTRNEILKEEIYQASNYLSQFTEVENLEHMHGFIITGLSKFGEALDGIHYRQIFLGLWQVLEYLALHKDNMNMIKVTNRISSILNKTGRDRHLLSAMRCIRNNLVHQGFFPDREGYEVIQLLKSIVENALKSVTQLSHSFSSVKILEKYYECISLNNIDLNAFDSAIDLIQNSRS